jgi:hypothetical protein
LLALKLPWLRVHRWLQERAAAQTGRLEDIRNQSTAIKHYTQVGFEKQRAPAVLFHSLHAYFEVREYVWSLQTRVSNAPCQLHPMKQVCGFDFVGMIWVQTPLLALSC